VVAVACLVVICLSGGLHVLKISEVILAGYLGYWLCMLLLSENLLWFATEGSVINVAIITVERYLKVVHPIWSKTKMTRCVIYTLAAIPWVISFVYNMTSAFTT